MNKLILVKAGTTFSETAARLGDFDHWTLRGLGLSAEQCAVVSVFQDEPLPPIKQCSGVVITGAHCMVTDDLPWSLALEQWLPKLVAAGIPILGVCYGHQLLARALGGEVGFHPGGKELGTVAVQRLAASNDDPLFNTLPESFPAHVTHAQTVLALPPGAVCLAQNDFEPHHAFRYGKNAWGVQFHPEYDSAIMGEYLRAQRSDIETRGGNLSAMLANVSETPQASSVLRRFAQIAGR
ncbi:MAG: glutamine amidotransferase [Desulfuromonadales bacterium]|nr:glutamine amidotransferase [Desulfuromonadales bacterium]